MKLNAKVCFIRVSFTVLLIFSLLQLRVRGRLLCCGGCLFDACVNAGVDLEDDCG
jgi:hypothetical protein